MKNITVSVDEETYRRARVAAAEHDTSVSALVRQFLRELPAKGSEFQRLQQLEKDVRARITGFSAADRLSRDELHRHDK